MSAVYDDTDSLKVGIPSPFGHIMGVTYVVSEKRALSTDFAASSHVHPPDD